MNKVAHSVTLPDVPKPALGIGQSIILIIIYYGLRLATLVLFKFFERSGWVILDTFTSGLIGRLIAWPITIWIGLYWSKFHFLEAFPIRSFPMRIVPPLLIVSFGMDILLGEIIAWFPFSEVFSENVNNLVAGSNRFLLFVTSVLIVPITEECFFRGLLLRGYLSCYSTAKAVWASSIIFALFHLNPWQGVFTLPLGLGFALLFLRTGSLFPSILSHMMVNFSTLFLLKPLRLIYGYDTEAMKAVKHCPVTMLALAGAMSIIGGSILLRQLAKSDS